MQEVEEDVCCAVVLGGGAAIASWLVHGDGDGGELRRLRLVRDSGRRLWDPETGEDACESFDVAERLNSPED